ncbi:DDB1- and CUL4-associated factor 11-like isoform X2 [Actinia tenebrosa]|uniref:DDB1- and CUL4-associated factor 11-like isoform X2 n=1 Tax=Actinia tenebrosa TaxID=6105 RepID=A0A6P8HWA0_ACTTE|nr:DDB1- and CUL4-associated factor 11-like isoform X2 [Actinia tenebrosa]
MGSRNTRNIASNTNTNQDNDSPDTDSGGEEPDLVRVLSHLLRSHVQFIRAPQSLGGGIHIVQGGRDSDENDDESDEDDLLFTGAYKQKDLPNPPDSMIDTSKLEESDIKQQVMISSGQTQNKKRNVLTQLKMRESGKLPKQKFSYGNRALASSNYLPNTVKIKAKYGQKAFCGTYSRDGTVFLSACQDEYIRLFDTTHGRFYNFHSIHARDIGWSIIDTAFSPDQHFLIYSSWSDYIHLCNIYGDCSTHVALDLKPRLRRFCAFSIAFSEDNAEILAGCNDSCLYIYDRASDKRTLRISGHDRDYDVNAIAFADASSQILFSAGDDGLCKVWDRRTLNESNPSPVGVFAGHSDGITFISSKNDTRHLITNCKDQTIKLWDLRKFSSQEGIDQTKHVVGAQRWDYRWQNVPRKNLRRKSLPGDSSIMSYRGHNVRNTLIRCYFSPTHTTGQRYIYTGCSSGSVVIYDILTGKMVSKLRGHDACVRDVSWHPYENKIVSSSWDGKVGLWQYEREIEELELEETGLNTAL